MVTHELRIDASRRLADEPETGHNRWHPGIPPQVRCEPGDEVVLETRDAFDGQIGPDATPEAVADMNLNVVHPLTGPVYVEGAEPGDLLVVDVVEMIAPEFGFTLQVPGFGYLRDHFPDPHVVKWELDGQFAVSEDLPRIRIPAAPFLGVVGVAPSHDLVRAASQRESDLLARGGAVLPPDPADAVPTAETVARDGLRTIPPRENGGNVDIKQTGAGTRLYFPVFVEGALFSAGDAHYAQGDGEACGTAIEMRSTSRFRFDLRKGAARERNVRGLEFERDEYFLAPEYSAPKRFHATTGISVRPDGTNESEDVGLAAENALLAMIDYLVWEHGYDRQQAYAICSVAVDLRISELPDVPNMLVTAFLPLDVLSS